MAPAGLGPVRQVASLRCIAHEIYGGSRVGMVQLHAADRGKARVNSFTEIFGRELQAYLIV
jgi:hypothetical protein